MDSLFLAPVSKINQSNIGLLAERDKKLYQAKINSNQMRGYYLFPSISLTVPLGSLYKLLTVVELWPLGTHPAVPGNNQRKYPPTIRN